jgi:hypothetical protein
MLLHIINKTKFRIKKCYDINLKSIDGVSLVIRKISFESLKAIRNMLFEVAILMIGVCIFFLSNPILSKLLISGVQEVFGIKKLNLIKWLPRFGRVGVGTTAGYLVASVKKQMGIHEILQESLSKDSILGSAIGSTMEIVSEDIKEKATVAATAGLIAVSTGSVEPALISNALYLPYKAIKSLGSTAVIEAGTGGGLGLISLGVTGFVLGSKYLAPELIEKSLSLPEKILKRLNELNSPSIKICSEIRSELTGKTIEIPTTIIDKNKSVLEVISVEIKENIPQLESSIVDVKKKYEIVDREFITNIISQKELQNNVPVIIEQGNFGFKIKLPDVIVDKSDFFLTKQNYQLEIPNFATAKKILNGNENLPDALKENEVLVNVIKSSLTHKYQNMDETVTTMGYKNPVYKSEIIEEYQGVEYKSEKIGPSEIEDAGSNLNKILKYSSEMCKVYIDNYTLTEHLIIIGSVSLISYGVYKLIKHYWKNPENVLND